MMEFLIRYCWIFALLISVVVLIIINRRDRNKWPYGSGSDQNND